MPVSLHEYTEYSNLPFHPLQLHSKQKAFPKKLELQWQAEPSFNHRQAPDPSPGLVNCELNSHKTAALQFVGWVETCTTLHYSHCI
eukprot:scaffold267093_cov18-Tisochrysis_lutea.AAC.1